ncbi:MAG: isomerase [Robiginitomaculum sp.]|nr:MAG: isomerase [Robiginitomaculum sp.]
MKLFTYETERGARVGFVFDDLVYGADLADVENLHTGRASETLSSMQAIIDGGDEALERVQGHVQFATNNTSKIDRLKLDGLSFLSPLPQPVKLICFSVYEQHIRQSIDAMIKAKLGRFGLLLNKIIKFMKVPPSFYINPVYYKGNTTSFIGHGQAVQWPSFAEDKMDYELELGIIIGKKGIDVPVEKANDYIWGYTIYNDVSARGRLIQELFKGKVGPLKSKDFHTGNVLGPWIVTADEIGNPQNLEMKVYVNDELRGRSNTAQMYYSLSELISAASEGEYIIPGEVIGTGAASNGAGIEQWTFLKPDDVIKLEIEGIGSLENKLIS